MIIEKTDRYSDELLGFVIACLFCEAISRSEFQSWCLELLGLEETPSFLYDLIEFDEPAFKIYKVIGYVPSWRHSKNEEYALMEWHCFVARYPMICRFRLLKCWEN